MRCLTTLSMGRVVLTLILMCAAGSANPIKDRLVDSEYTSTFVEALPFTLQLNFGVAHGEGGWISTVLMCGTEGSMNPLPLRDFPTA